MQTNDAVDNYQALAKSVEIAMENATQNGDSVTANTLAAILSSIRNRKLPAPSTSTQIVGRTVSHLAALPAPLRLIKRNE